VARLFACCTQLSSNNKTGGFMQTQKVDFFERMFNQAEVIVNYYADHREQLWRPFTKFAMLASILRLVLLVPSFSEFYVLAQLQESVYSMIQFYHFLGAGLILGVSFAVQNFLKQQKSAGINAAMVLLVLCLIFGYFLTFLLGLYVFFNKAFREDLKNWEKSSA
jgi:hypothetical protein